eukprot:scaffold16988_cov40-Cyclotella_meneghiniana.AAC.1
MVGFGRKCALKGHFRRPIIKGLTASACPLPTSLGYVYVVRYARIALMCLGMGRSPSAVGMKSDNRQSTDNPYKIESQLCNSTVTHPSYYLSVCFDLLSVLLIEAIHKL